MNNLDPNQTDLTKAPLNAGVLSNARMPNQINPVEFNFYRDTGGKISKTSNLCESLFISNPADEVFLFITAHDDDPILGAGLMIQAARQEGIPVHILVTTDGSMGYERPGHNHRNLPAIRREETYAGYKLLGVDKEYIHFLDYPDANLAQHQGRRPLKLWEHFGRLPRAEGFTGLQNSYVHEIRKIKPTRAFLHTENDPHPDHKIVFREALWGLFVAAGKCWQELGAPLGYRPKMQEYFVYSEFSGEPTWQIESVDAAEVKIKAVEKFWSQGDIGGLTEARKRDGAFEWHKSLTFKEANRSQLKNLFES